VCRFRTLRSPVRRVVGFSVDDALPLNAADLVAWGASQARARRLLASKKNHFGRERSGWVALSRPSQLRAWLGVGFQEALAVQFLRWKRLCHESKPSDLRHGGSRCARRIQRGTALQCRAETRGDGILVTSELSRFDLNHDFIHAGTKWSALWHPILNLCLSILRSAMSIDLSRARKHLSAI